MSHNGKKQYKPRGHREGDRCGRYPSLGGLEKSRVYLRTSFSAHIVADNESKCNSIFKKNAEKIEKI